MHFTEPSEIQEKSIPQVIAGKDVIAGSATGSGKTLAFGAGIIQNCIKGKGVQSLVLTPTRELAEQVAMALRQFSKYKPLNIAAVYGGVSINPQIDELTHTDVVVGTPGRILDHLERTTLSLRSVRILVLDEADRMLDMGFIEDVERIMSACPKERQTLLFSATVPPEIVALAQNYMHNPEEVSVTSFVDPQKLSQAYYDVQDNLKLSLLAHLLKQEHPGLVMVFCNTQNTTDFVANNLKAQGIDALPIHGGLSQAKRNSIIKQFHAQRVFALVCTDVAARGLDIPGVSHVYNFDIPKDSKQYIHRIGRTARAGNEGRAINLLANRDHDNYRRILRDYDITVTKEEMPKVERIQLQWVGEERHEQRHGGSFRGRSSRGPPPRRRFN
ncbi:DEAD/DEAH box helicase [Candidatus Woesearchaeota archaeon]|nr:DEAD/DEAH box helicase [Candidatus Woesearchaeota archaeon]